MSTTDSSEKKRTIDVDTEHMLIIKNKIVPETGFDCNKHSQKEILLALNKNHPRSLMEIYESYIKRLKTFQPFMEKLDLERSRKTIAHLSALQSNEHHIFN